MQKKIGNMHTIDSAGTLQVTCVHHFDASSATQFNCIGNQECCGDKCCKTDMGLSPLVWIGVAFLIIVLLMGLVSWVICRRRISTRDKLHNEDLLLQSKDSERPDSTDKGEQYTDISKSHQECYLAPLNVNSKIECIIK